MGLAIANLSRVLELDAPVLMLDTCALLDLIRDITRRDTEVHNMIAAAAMLKAAENQDLVMMIADQVRLEIDDNRKAVEEEARGALRKFAEQAQRVNGIVRQFGESNTLHTAHLVEHVARAAAVLDQWFALAVAAPAGPSVAAKAFQRVAAGRAPSKKGKESAKDCFVIETYLEVATELRSSKYMGRIVFASSNTADYSDAATKALRLELQQDFDAPKIEYAPNFGAAKHSLRL